MNFQIYKASRNTSSFFKYAKLLFLYSAVTSVGWFFTYLSHPPVNCTTVGVVNQHNRWILAQKETRGRIKRICVYVCVFIRQREKQECVGIKCLSCPHIAWVLVLAGANWAQAPSGHVSTGLWGENSTDESLLIPTLTDAYGQSETESRREKTEHFSLPN